MRKLLVLLLLVSVGAALGAQTALLTDPVRVFHSTVWGQTIVRAPNGHLYLVYCKQVKSSPQQFDLFLARSTDGGKTWNMQWQTGFAPLGTNDYGNRAPVLAVDGQGNLHVAWWHQTSSATTDRTVRYRRWNATKNQWDPMLVLTSTPYRTHVYAALAVDAKDYVWIMHSENNFTWRSMLSRSTQPFNAQNQFQPFTPSLPSASARQYPDLAVDALGRIHVTYYTNSPVSIQHVWIDPAAATPQWSSPVNLANTNATADYFSSLTADAQGNVYVVYGQDVQGGKPDNPKWFLRRWNGQTQTWSNPINFYSTTRSQWQPTTGANSGMVIQAAVDEATGELYFIYRDVDQGELVLARWRNGDTQATPYAKLMNTGTLAPNLTNYFIFPQLRGSLYPVSNRTAWGLHMVYTVGDQTATNPTFTLYWDHFPIGSLSSSAAPQIGTKYPLNLQAPEQGGKPYFTALTLSGITPGIAVGRRFVPAVPDPLFFITFGNLVPAIFQNFAGNLSANGTATATIVIPNSTALVGLKVDALFITVDGSNVGAISNPFGFTIVQ